MEVDTRFYHRTYFQSDYLTEMMPGEVAERLFRQYHDRCKLEGWSMWWFAPGLFERQTEVRKNLLLAVGEISHELTESIKPLSGVTVEGKKQLACDLARRISKYGVQLSCVGDRYLSLKNDAFSEEELQAIDEAGLITGVKIRPRYNINEWRGGFGGSEAWDRAVLETAAGIKECRFCHQGDRINLTDSLEMQFYIRALEIGRKK